MALAGVGWGIYSLAGRLNRDALQATAANFILAAPVGVAAALVWPAGPGGAEIGRDGILLAIASGALTSGVGYAMWYSILPRIGASVAAVAQLTVPVIAMAGGMIFLAEALDWQFVMATVLVLGGVAISVLPFGRR
jgi:drug/metabolite transporter (DMT)-like permease